MKTLILEHCPSAEAFLNVLDKVIADKEKSRSPFDSNIEDQKLFYSDLAKNLGMDPDDKDCRFGQLVARGLKNYDPTDVIGHCQHMFVDYRAGG